MTPVEIEALLHCYYRSDPPSNATSLAVKDATKTLLSNGLIDHQAPPGKWFETTDQGNAHVIQLMLTPLPSHCWVGSGGNLITPVKAAQPETERAPHNPSHQGHYQFEREHEQRPAPSSQRRRACKCGTATIMHSLDCPAVKEPQP